MNPASSVFAIAVVLVFGAQACGGSGAGTCGDKPSLSSPPTGVTLAACGDLTPCGGDVVGSWTFVTGCEEQAATPAGYCAGFTVPASMEEEQQGSITFHADGTYERDSTEDIHFHWEYALSCFQLFDTCAAAGADTMSKLGPLQSDGTGSTYSCTGGCLCECTQNIKKHFQQTGTFAVIGNTLSLDDRKNPYGFCVKGDRMTWALELSSKASTGQTVSFGEGRVLSRATPSASP